MIQDIKGLFSTPNDDLSGFFCYKDHPSEERKDGYSCYFKIAGITFLVQSDLPIDENTFNKKFLSFQTDGPGEDTVTIFHHFFIPRFNGSDYGREVYRNIPWAIYSLDAYEGQYIYQLISTNRDDLSLYQIAIFTADHNHSCIYNDDNREKSWREGNLHSLTMFPSDQILISRLLADRNGCYLHSAGAIVNEAGLLFVGHSEAGKSTTTNFLIDAGARGDFEVEILCDDRNIVRRYNNDWLVYGTWSHGDVPLVSSSSAPLKAICFIEQSHENIITSLTDRKEIIRRLLPCVIRPFVTADWWEKTLELIELMVQQVPCYVMRFDKSGSIVKEILQLIATKASLHIS